MVGLTQKEIYEILRNTFHSQSGLFLNKAQCDALATIIYLMHQNQNKE
jgi:hypothetical protein